MKAKDLQRPFKWNERKVVLKDGVLFIPSYYDNYQEFQFNGWNAFFGNENPVHVEYCSGNGAWIAKKALETPSLNWVAIEMDFDRVRKIWANGKRLGLTNLFIVCGEGHNATARYFPKESVSGIYINFPDPWPKRCHAKHRIIKLPFIEELSRILKKEGELTFVTDDVGYSAVMNKVMKDQSILESVHADPFYTTTFEGYGASFFDSLWREQGKEIRYHQYRKSS